MWHYNQLKEVDDMDDQNKIASIVVLAKNIIKHIQNRLYMQYHFLEQAIYRLNMVEIMDEQLSFATNGVKLYYNPKSLLERFQKNSEMEQRRFLHSILHCIYMHPFCQCEGGERLWSLACDIAVEATILTQLDAFPLDSDHKKLKIIKEIENMVLLITVHEVYRCLSMHSFNIEEWEALFSMDEHMWLRSNEEAQMDLDAQGEEKHETKDQSSDDYVEQSKQGTDSNDASRQKTDDAETADHDKAGDANENGEPAQGGNDAQKNIVSGASLVLQTWRNLTIDERDMAAKHWKEASRRIKVDMETYSRGMVLSEVMQKNIANLTRDQMDYSAFLRLFAVTTEKMMLDMDAFDYMYYTYGLGLPGRKKLLIEPLEYKDILLVREFVIALDTSGSCWTGVHKFLKKTFSVLKSTEAFASTVNIHIVQCDDKIRDDCVIHDLSQIDTFMQKYKINGCGGTSFVPVFDYVDQLIAAGEFKHLSGLIYFTDGWGEYPCRVPEYKTAFIFLERYVDRHVPSWALKYYWKEED